MTQSNELTAEDLQEILAFIKYGKTDVLQTRAIDKLYILASATGEKMREYNQTLQKKMLTMECKLQKYQLKETRLPEGTFKDSDLDSVDVAMGLIYCLQQKSTYRLTKTKVTMILYGMYCSWLGSKKERLFIEHPVATSWGPQFWRVYKRLDNLDKRLPDSVYKTLAEKNPGIAVFCRNTANKYYDWKESTLKEHFLNSEPYIHALPKKNEKWNKEISDAEIYAWKNPSNNQNM